MTQVSIQKSINLSEIEISYRTKTKPSERTKIISSRDAYSVLRFCYDDSKIDYVETFIVLLMNRANLVLGWCKISQGGISGTVVDKRIIFQAALMSNATGIIISHNHPSGNIKPSDADINITKEIKEAGKLMEIPLLDHIIVTSESFYSFADEELI